MEETEKIKRERRPTMRLPRRFNIGTDDDRGVEDGGGHRKARAPRKLELEGFVEETDVPAEPEGVATSETSDKINPEKVKLSPEAQEHSPGSLAARLDSKMLEQLNGLRTSLPPTELETSLDNKEKEATPPAKRGRRRRGGKPFGVAKDAIDEIYSRAEEEIKEGRRTDLDDFPKTLESVGIDEKAFAEDDRGKIPGYLQARRERLQRLLDGKNSKETTEKKPSKGKGVRRADHRNIPKSSGVKDVPQKLAEPKTETDTELVKKIESKESERRRLLGQKLDEFAKEIMQSVSDFSDKGTLSLENQRRVISVAEEAFMRYVDETCSVLGGEAAEEIINQWFANERIFSSAAWFSGGASPSSRSVSKEVLRSTAQGICEGKISTDRAEFEALSREILAIEEKRSHVFDRAKKGVEEYFEKMKEKIERCTQKEDALEILADLRSGAPSRNLWKLAGADPSKNFLSAEKRKELREFENEIYRSIFSLANDALSRFPESVDSADSADPSGTRSDHEPLGDQSDLVAVAQDGGEEAENVVDDAPKPADVSDVPAAPASPEPDPAASTLATGLELPDTPLGEESEDDAKPNIFRSWREVPEGVSDGAPYQARERTRSRVQELRNSVLKQEGFVRDANEEYTAADVKLSDMVKLRNTYGAGLSSFFGKFFAKESVLARCDNDIQIQQAYWEEKKHAAEIERKNLRDLQKELSLAEQELREISGEEAVDIASESEPEERAENLPEDLDAARKAYAEAWARNPDGIEEAKEQYEQVIHRLKQEKIDRIKKLDDSDQEAAYAEVSMFFYEEATHLSDAQVEAKRRRPDFPEKLAATIERVGKAWNKIPLSAKLAIGGVLAVSAAAVPPAGLVVAALRRSLSLAGSFTAASGIAKKWDAAAREKDREAERSVRKDAAKSAFSLKDGFNGKEKGEEAKILFIESALGRVLDEDIKLLDTRAEKLRKKTAQRKWSARIGAIALGEAIIHGAGWAREYFAENFDNVSGSSSTTATSGAETSPALSTEQPELIPAPEVTSNEASSGQIGFMRAAYSSDNAGGMPADAGDAVPADVPTGTGVPVPDSGDFSAQTFVSGGSQRITIPEGGSVEGEIRKALEENGMSHEASGSAAHRIVLEHGGSFDDVKPGVVVTFDGVDGGTGLPKIAGMTPPEGVSMEAGAPQMSVTDSSEAVPVSSELEIQPGSAGASEPYAAITRESALHIRNAYEALDPIVRVEFDTTREAFTKGIFTGDAAFEDTEQLLDRNVNDLLSLRVLDEKTASNLQSFRDAAAQAFPGKQIFSEPIGAPLPKETLRDYIERVTMFVYHAKHQGAPVTIGNFGGFREIF